MAAGVPAPRPHGACWGRAGSLAWNMSEPPNDCPDWIQGQARREWLRLSAKGLSGGAAVEVVAAYCIASSALEQVQRALSALPLEENGSPAEAPGSGSRQELLELETALSKRLRSLADALEADPDKHRPHRATRIFVVDEGPPGDPE